MISIKQLALAALLAGSKLIHGEIIGRHLRHEACESGTEIVINDSDPTSVVKADLYGCTDSNTLAIVAPGGSISKDSYSIFAEELAKKGVLVAVMEHWVQFGPSSANAVTPIDMSSAIEKISADYGTLESTFLIGHSFGAANVLFALTGVCVLGCDFTFVPLHPSIKAGIGFGASLYEPNSGWQEGLKNAHYTGSITPFLLLNGSGDSIELEGKGQGTHDRLYPEKIYTVAEDLDHCSIADEGSPTCSDTNGDVSLLPREDQVELVTEIIAEYFEYILESEAGFCAKITDEFEDDIVGCQEELA